MKSLLPIFTLVFLAAIALGDDRHNAPNTPHGGSQGQSALVQIRGTVTDAAKKQYVSGVLITMEPLSGYPASTVTATTDGQGRYTRMVTRTTRNYRVSASKKGYEFTPSSQEVRGAGGTADFKGKAAQ